MGEKANDDLKVSYPWRDKKKLAFHLGVSVGDFWAMTPIEFKDLYDGYVEVNGGIKEQMTVEKGKELEREIENRLNKKGIKL